MAYQAKRHQPNNHRGYLPMENAIARKLDPPEINPVEIESVLLNRLASVGQKSYAEHMGISESTVRLASVGQKSYAEHMGISESTV
ncbi:lambda phage CII family protein, partial [Salmonella enterica subsp. enterica serovar Pomona]